MKLEKDSLFNILIYPSMPYVKTQQALPTSAFIVCWTWKLTVSNEFSFVIAFMILDVSKTDQVCKILALLCKFCLI